MRYRTFIIPLAALALVGCRNAANDDPANEVIHADRTGGLTPRVHHQARTRPPGHALPSRHPSPPADDRVRQQLPPQ